MKRYLLLIAAGAFACGLAQAQDPNAAPPAATPPAQNQTPPPPARPAPPKAPEPPRTRFPAPERGPDQRRPEDQRPPHEHRRPDERHDDHRPDAGPRPPHAGGDRQAPWNRGAEQRPGFGGPGAPGRPQMPTPPPQPTPFLGVMTMPLPEPLNAQLKIPQGFGLLVADVLPNSPAANAGIRKFDVLRLYNDQQLSEPGQLQALVRATGKDKEASITVVREAQEQKVTVKVGERMAPPRGASPYIRPLSDEAWNRARGMYDRTREMTAEGAERARRMQQEAAERARAFQEKARMYREQHQQRPQPRPEGTGTGGSEERPRSGASIPAEEILRQAQPGGGGNVQVSTETSVSTLEGAKSRLRFSDNDVEIEVAGENGHRVLTARTPDGKMIFNGPVDTHEQREAVPAPIREKLERIRVRPGAADEARASSAAAALDAPPAELDVQ